ncbi:MAG: serpin family protein, partial [Candidatus Eisenbacteria bacterium]
MPLAQSVNAFACDLHRRLRATPGNLIHSPMSISAAMGLAYAGARGTTRSEMREVLHLPAEDAAAYAGYRSLFADLEAGARSGGTRWTLANRMWAQQGAALEPAFVRTTQEDFGSEIGALDF